MLHRPDEFRHIATSKTSGPGPVPLGNKVTPQGHYQYETNEIAASHHHARWLAAISDHLTKGSHRYFVVIGRGYMV